MPITDVFRGQRGGISVGGKLEGGAVAVGTSVRVMPSNETGTVRSIQVDAAAVTLARAGDSADLTLTGSICLPWQQQPVCICTPLLQVSIHLSVLD